MSRSLVPFLFLVLALGFGSIAQADHHEEANPCATRAAEKANPCGAKEEAEAELPAVDSGAEAAAEARESGAGEGK